MSCSESVGMSGAILSDKKISFTATEMNGWTPNSDNRSNDAINRCDGVSNDDHPLIVKSDLGKPLYLHPVEQVGTYFYNDKDELVTRSGVPLSEINNQNDKGTRGTMVTSINTALGVSAVWNDGKGNSSQYFLDKKAALSNSNNISTWHTDEDLFWATNGTLDFYAYAPYSGISNGMLSVPNNGSDDASKVLNARTVHYVASQSDIENQPDFIVAKNTNNSFASTDAVKAVNLHFSHALTAITFAVGKDMVPGKISKITVRGVKGEGDYNIATNTWNTDNVTADAEYTIDNLGPNSDGTITGEKDVALTNNNQTLLMIPQALGSDAEVEIVFDNDNGAKTLTASLSGTSWEAGHSIIYKLSASEVTTLSLGNIEFPTNWSSQYTTTANKLKSAYANGNQVGLFIVDDNNKLRNANVAVTYNSTSKTWSIPADKTCLFSPRFQYFAYYPYQENLTGMPTEGSTITISGNTAEEKATNFFNTAIDNWQPASDQSDLDKLDKCDLQVGMANISNTASSIDFNTMTHAMGLADITLDKGLNYELSDKTYDWTSAIVSDKFVDNLPCELSYNRYVAIVKPNVSTIFNATVKGWKGAWKEKLSYSPSMAEIEAHTAVREDDEKHPYTLALGDIYYKNGAVTHSEDDLEPAAANTPIGIVAYLAKGDNSDKYWIENGTGSGYGGHALVMGLKTIGSTGTLEEASKGYVYGGTESAATKSYKAENYMWYTSNTNIGGTYLNNSAAIIASKSATYGSGYIMTPGHSSAFQVFNALVDYNKNNKAPEKSTGWFVATAGQYYAAIILGVGKASDCTWTVYRPESGSAYDGYVKRNGKVTDIATPINEALARVGDGNYTVFSNNIYRTEWTATQYQANQAVVMGFCFGGNNGCIVFQRSDYPAPRAVRPFLAF